MSSRLSRAGYRRARGDGGTALIEFAIVAPLLFALLLGMFTGGITMSRKNSMTSAVREGARLGATLTETGSWAASVQNQVVTLAAGDVTSSQVCVRLVKAPSTVVRTSPCSAGLSGLQPSMSGIPTGECAVLVWSSRTSDMQFVFFRKTVTLTGRSVSRYERTCP